MDADSTQKYYRKYSVPKGAIYGATGGLVAGWVMAPFLMITFVILGIPDNTFFVILGEYSIGSQAGVTPLQAGFVLHIAASVIVGTIFGIVTASIEKLRITSFVKSIAEGMSAGMIAFIVLFMPVMTTAFQNLTQVIAENNQDLTEGQIASLAGQVFPAMIALSMADHLIYGAILGVVTAGFVVGVRKVNKKTTKKGV